MTPNLLIDRDSDLFRSLHDAVVTRRCVFIAGLPGVGKSLMLQQLTLIAAEVGRAVHLLQWDVARGAFETPELLARYPEVDGVTHAAIRKAAGLWARDAVHQWDQANPESHHLLLGELPLIGNRLIELARSRSDALEPMLASNRSIVFVPVPTRQVRGAIESARERDTASPKHEREAANAAPHLVESLWRELDRAAVLLGVTPSRYAGSYAPDVYEGVYRELLRHRQHAILPITEILPVSGSAYDVAGIASELVPAPADVERVMATVEREPSSTVQRDVAEWYRLW